MLVLTRVTAGHNKTTSRNFKSSWIDRSFSSLGRVATVYNRQSTVTRVQAGINLGSNEVLRGKAKFYGGGEGVVVDGSISAASACMSHANNRKTPRSAGPKVYPYTRLQLGSVLPSVHEKFTGRSFTGHPRVPAVLDPREPFFPWIATDDARSGFARVNVHAWPSELKFKGAKFSPKNLQILLEPCQRVQTPEIQRSRQNRSNRAPQQTSKPLRSITDTISDYAARYRTYN